VMKFKAKHSIRIRSRLCTVWTAFMYGDRGPISDYQSDLGLLRAHPATSERTAHAAPGEPQRRWRLPSKKIYQFAVSGARAIISALVSSARDKPMHASSPI